MNHKACVVNCQSLAIYKERPTKGPGDNIYVSLMYSPNRSASFDVLDSGSVHFSMDNEFLLDLKYGPKC